MGAEPRGAVMELNGGTNLSGDRDRRGGILAIAAVVVAISWCCFPAPAASWADEDPVQAGADALRRGPRTPWYDRGEDQVRAAPVQPSPDPFPHRNSDWLQRAATNNPRNINWNWGGDFWGVMQVLAWLLIVLLIGLLIATLVMQYVKRNSPSSAFDDEADADSDWYDEGRVEQLPVSVGKGDLLSEAKRAYEAGDLRNAIIYLYSYQLLRLDGGQIIRLARGKTNREYLREARRSPALHKMLRQTMIAFEDVYFGNHRLPVERFESCWRELDQFHHQLEQTAA